MTVRSVRKLKPVDLRTRDFVNSPLPTITGAVLSSESSRRTPIDRAIADALGVAGRSIRA
jgi:hypothetical protein